MSPARVLCKLSAQLLRYPDEAWLAELGAVGATLAEMPGSREVEALAAFVARCRAEALGALQEEYVATFDFGEGTTLYLTAHTFGQEKDRALTPQRGYALAQLNAAYAAHGLELRDGELPDSLPVLLEFVAEVGCPTELARYLPALLRSTERLATRAEERGCAYAPVVSAARSVLAQAFRDGSRDQGVKR